MELMTCYEVERLEHAERLRRSEQRRCGEEARRGRQASPVASAAGPLRLFRALTTRPSRA